MPLSEPISIFLSSFSLVALAEIGDKSQLVCMTLAARHRHWPVILGATLAFCVLNTLAVLFGAGISVWLPDQVVAAMVAILFAAFGIHALRNNDNELPQGELEMPGYNIFFTTLLLIFVAEFGDKTQIAIAGLASNMEPVSVWLGATAALVVVSALGVWAGRTVLQRLPLMWLHKFSGGLFLLFAVLAARQIFI